MTNERFNYLPSQFDCMMTIIDALLDGNISHLDEIESIDDVSLAEIFIVPEDDETDIQYPDQFIDMPELKSRIMSAVADIRGIKGKI